VRGLEPDDGLLGSLAAQHPAGRQDDPPADVAVDPEGAFAEHDRAAGVEGGLDLDVVVDAVAHHVRRGLDLGGSVGGGDDDGGRPDAGVRTVADRLTPCREPGRAVRCAGVEQIADRHVPSRGALRSRRVNVTGPQAPDEPLWKCAAHRPWRPGPSAISGTLPPLSGLTVARMTRGSSHPGSGSHPARHRLISTTTASASPSRTRVAIPNGHHRRWLSGPEGVTWPRHLVNGVAPRRDGS